MIITLNTHDTDRTRRLRRLIGARMGADAATVFFEAAGNALDHADGDARLMLHARRFEVHTPIPMGPATVKPAREGGYGIGIIETLGGRIHRHERGVSVAWG